MGMCFANFVPRFGDHFRGICFSNPFLGDILKVCFTNIGNMVHNPRKMF